MRPRSLLVLVAGLAFAAACGDDASSDNDAGGGSAGVAGSGATSGAGGSLAGAGGSLAGAGGSLAGAGGSLAGAGGSLAGAGGSLAGAGGSAGQSGGGGQAGSVGQNDAGGDAAQSGVPLPGLGTIGGDCGPIDATEILSPSPFYFDTSLDFGTSPFDVNALSTGGKKIWADGNLGGSSLYSEVFSYEVLYRCELAKLLKTETEIVYGDSLGKKTDLLVEIDGYKLGVSVTRAFAYPPGSTYSVTQAQSLLEKKLADILASTQNVSAGDAWKKQILHVLAYDAQHKDALFQAYPSIPATTRADTLVMVTVTDGDDAYLY